MEKRIIKTIISEKQQEKKGSMQSLYLFLKERQSLYGIRCSYENFCAYENIKVIPGHWSKIIKSPKEMYENKIVHSKK